MYKRVEMSLAEIYESSREICHFDLQKDPKGLTDDFIAVKESRKRYGLVIYSHLKLIL